MGRSGHPIAWVRAEKANEVLARALFEEPASTSLALETVEACAEDGWKRVAAALGLSVCVSGRRAPCTADVAAWSGALEVALSATLDMRVLLRGEAVEAWCASNTVPRAASTRAPVAPLSTALEALAEHSVALQVQLRGCELEVGCLQELRVGDVVRLPHPLDAPVFFVGPSDTALLGGYLGRVDERKAVELVAASAGALEHHHMTQGQP